MRHRIGLFLGALFLIGALFAAPSPAAATYSLDACNADVPPGSGVRTLCAFVLPNGDYSHSVANFELSGSVQPAQRVHIECGAYRSPSADIANTGSGGGFGFDASPCFGKQTLAWIDESANATPMHVRTWVSDIGDPPVFASGIGVPMLAHIRVTNQAGSMQNYFTASGDWTSSGGLVRTHSFSGVRQRAPFEWDYGPLVSYDPFEGGDNQALVGAAGQQKFVNRQTGAVNTLTIRIRLNGTGTWDCWLDFATTSPPNTWIVEKGCETTVALHRGTR